MLLLNPDLTCISLTLQYCSGKFMSLTPDTAKQNHNEKISLNHSRAAAFRMRDKTVSPGASGYG